jgi:hypothetical protein
MLIKDKSRVVKNCENIQAADVSEGYGVVEFCAGYHVVFSLNSTYEMLEDIMIASIIIELVVTQY